MQDEPKSQVSLSIASPLDGDRRGFHWTRCYQPNVTLNSGVIEEQSWRDLKRLTIVTCNGELLLDHVNWCKYVKLFKVNVLLCVYI